MLKKVSHNRYLYPTENGNARSNWEVMRIFIKVLLGFCFRKVWAMSTEHKNSCEDSFEIRTSNYASSLLAWFIFREWLILWSRCLLKRTGSCICLRLDLHMPHVSLLSFYAYRLYLTCIMDKSSLRHIHDPVLLPLKVEVIC